ncbi:PKD domain containing protein [Luedemannella flava]
MLALTPGPTGTVLAGGSFAYVNGGFRRGLALMSLWTGDAVPSFRATINGGDVRTLATHGGEVYVGGTFGAIGGYRRTGLARILASTGAVDQDFALEIAGGRFNRAKIEDLALSPAGDRLVAIGALSRVDGWLRPQLAMIDTGARPARLSSWFTEVYAPPCRAGFDTYLRAVDFSPDGRYFVVVTTGRASRPDRMCDTAARFETGGVGSQVPTWVNHTGGDSLYAVSVTGSAVYVGGHQRWMNNPYGYERPGPGAVNRPGIAALDPRNGGALYWNPTRSRGVGTRALVATRDGLFVGSDTDRLGGEYHARLGMFPLYR